MPCVVEARRKEPEISSGFSIAQHLPVFGYNEEGTEMVSFFTLRWDDRNFVKCLDQGSAYSAIILTVLCLI